MSAVKQPDEVDRFVGERIRQARREKQMTQMDIAELMGLTFQQVQKYEKGTNRVACGRLLKFSQVLDRQITYFFPKQPKRSGADMRAEKRLEVSDLKKKIRKEIGQIKNVDDLRAIARLVDLAAS